MRGKRLHAHVQDDRSAGARERRPVDGRRLLCRILMAGHEGHRRRDAAMRDRNSRVRRRRDSRRHARHDLERHAGRGQRLRLFASAPEDERIAAFQAHDALAFARRAHEQRVDRRPAAPTPIAPPRLPTSCSSTGVVALLHRRQRQQRGIGQRVVDDRVAGDEQLAAAQREQPRIARSRADEVDDASSPSFRARSRASQTPVESRPQLGARARPERSARSRVVRRRDACTQRDTVPMVSIISGLASSSSAATMSRTHAEPIARANERDAEQRERAEPPAETSPASPAAADGLSGLSTTGIGCSRALNR